MDYLSYELEIKAVEDAGQFSGYASTFGNVDLQGDIVEPGAFTATLAKSKGRVPILMAHQGGRIVGFGTEAEQDDKGLKVAGAFTLDADDGRNAYAIAKHAAGVGHRLGLSIGYGVRKNGASYDEATGIRHLTALDLYEYSIAAVPANPQARMTRVKSDARLTTKEIEETLREAGFSQNEAKRLMFCMKVPCEAALETLPGVDGPARETALIQSALRQADLAFRMARVRGS